MGFRPWRCGAKHQGWLSGKHGWPLLRWEGMNTSGYHNLVRDGVCAWCRRLVRSGRYAYGRWRKSIAIRAGKLCEMTDRTALLAGLRGLAGELRKAEGEAEDRRAVRTLKTRCLDLIRALESAASRSERLLSDGTK